MTEVPGPEGDLPLGQSLPIDSTVLPENRRGSGLRAGAVCLGAAMIGLAALAFVARMLPHGSLASSHAEHTALVPSGSDTGHHENHPEEPSATTDQLPDPKGFRRAQLMA